MGTIGGSLVLGLGMIFATGSVNNTYMRYTGYFCAVGGVMIFCLTMFLLTVRENKFVSEMEEFSREHGLSTAEEDEEAKKSGNRKLSRSERISLILLLASVVFWFFGYNAVTSKYSVYASSVLSLDYNSTLLVANIAALIAYIPVGFIASKFGRKKTVITGVIMLSTAFLIASFLDSGTPLPVMMVLFSLAGIGWATINVNSFPMVVALATGSNVGRYTGYYYTASMAAQTITPIFSGFLMDQLGYRILFPYAAIAAALAIVTMCFVKHGDAKPIRK
jgi:Na+/melibiose symporter-like transporter